METALDRLSKIETENDFRHWIDENKGYDIQTNAIKEVVALAKQQPNIDAMRFEAAKAAAITALNSDNGMTSKDVLKDLGLPLDIEYKYEYYVEYCVKWGCITADALIAELQKPKP
jgi:hypothetical protein